MNIEMKSYMDNTYEILYDLILKEGICESSELTPEAKLLDLGIDSLAMVELFFDLEDRLGFKLPEDQYEFTTIKDVAEFVERVKAAR
jgi:acyl carrier protein